MYAMYEQCACACALNTQYYHQWCNSLKELATKAEFYFFANILFISTGAATAWSESIKADVCEG